MLEIGVIGVGVHGLHHVRLLAGMKDVGFAGVYDTNSAAAVAAAGPFGVRVFPDMHSLLDAVDCVTVAVPTSSHHAVVMECLGHGRHVLVEKPIASTVAEAEEMAAEAETRGLVLAVGHLERFNPAYRALDRFRTTPSFVETHRLSVFNPRGTDVPVVLDLMIHDIDILLDLVKRPVVSVQASGVAVVSGGADIANARIEFEGGCVANLTASRLSQKKMRKFRIFQRNAYLSLDFLTGESEIFTVDSSTRPEPRTNEPPQLMQGIAYTKTVNDGLNALELEIADFLGAAVGGGRPCVDGHDGLRALEVASRVIASVEASLRTME